MAMTKDRVWGIVNGTEADTREHYTGRKTRYYQQLSYQTVLHCCTYLEILLIQLLLGGSLRLID